MGRSRFLQASARDLVEELYISLLGVYICTNIQNSQMGREKGGGAGRDGGY